MCVGAAGQAIALASFAASTGDPSWRKRAREFLDGLRPRWPKDDHIQSLFRGELGLLLARLECASEAPRFPVWGASLVQSSTALEADTLCFLVNNTNVLFFFQLVRSSAGFYPPRPKAAAMKAPRADQLGK